MASEKRRGRPPHDDVLTRSEWRVTHAVQHGMTDRQIAARTGVSRDGVKFHVKNVLAKLDLPSRKALRAWFRSPKDSALHRQVTHSMVDVSLGPIGQISRSVGNIERAEHWYGKVLGLPHLYTFGNLAFFDCAGTRLMLSQGDSPPGSDSILYFRVPDIRRAHNASPERLTEAPPALANFSDTGFPFGALLKEIRRGHERPDLSEFELYGRTAKFFDFECVRLLKAREILSNCFGGYTAHWYIHSLR